MQRIILLSCLLTFVICHQTIRLDLKKSRLGKRDMYRSRLYNHRNTEYLIEIGIGAPHTQNFTVALDTGSSELWIPSVSCPAQECPLGRYVWNTSSTYQAQNRPFTIEYGIGTVRNGTYGRDTLYLMHHQVQLKDHLIGFASSTQDLIFNQYGTANGIFGLGYPKGGQEADHILNRLVNQGFIDKPVFSLVLTDQKGWSGGELVLGGTQDSVVYEPLIQQDQHDYWMIGGKGVYLMEGDRVIQDHAFESVRGMIIDTGTTLSYMDAPLVSELVRAIAKEQAIFDQMTGTYLVDCRLKDASQRVDILFSQGYRLKTFVRDLILSYDDQEPICMFGIAPWITNTMSQKMNEHGWILLGDSILRSNQLVFDMASHHIGFKPNVN